MTNKEYISVSLNRFGLTEDEVALVLVDAGLNPDDAADVIACRKAIYNNLSKVLPVALQNISEGGFSISWNIEAIKLYYRMLANELGMPNVLEPQPIVTDVSNRW